MKYPALTITAILAFTALAADVHLAWDPHPEPDVKFRIHWGTAPGTYTHRAEFGTNLTAQVTGLTPGRTWYFAATAFVEDEEGKQLAESDYSKEVEYTPELPPPSALRVDVTVNVTVSVNKP